MMHNHAAGGETDTAAAGETGNAHWDVARQIDPAPLILRSR